MRLHLRPLPLLLLLALAPAASAQEVRASITGVVTDPSGAPIAGARITVTNAASNIVVTSVTNATGTYLTPFLAPGRWELVAEASGFTKYLRPDILLQAQDRVRVDIGLQVGDITTSVTVNAAVSQLQTETATRSQVL